MIKKNLFIKFLESLNLKIDEELVPSEFVISTDTRQLSPGEVYLGIKGENFDGGNFCEQALESGAPFCISQSPTDNPKVLVVENSLTFLQKLMNLRIREWKALNPQNVVIGITGSNGKTTTKEMLYHLLSGVFGEEVMATSGNFNNHIGVPLTINRLRDGHRIAILEMGTNHYGEIQTLCEIGEPDLGIITQIGDSHLEFLINRDGVLKEKRALYDWVQAKGKAKCYFPWDDSKLQRLEDGIFIEVTSFEGDSVVFNGVKITNKGLTGFYNFKNLAVAFALATDLFPEHKERFLDLASSFKPKHNRSSWIDFNSTKVFLDAYNANPTSMIASLESFIQFLEIKDVEMEKALFIIGDMNELGGDAPKYHQELGEYLRSSKVVNCVFVGRFLSDFKRGYKNQIFEFSSASEIPQDLRDSWFQQYDFIFAKASRSLQLESIFAIN